MKIYYLDHSGVAVETDRHLLIFDYYTDSPVGGSLTEGVITLDKLPEGKRLVAFASHKHGDHYNRVIHEWQQARPDTIIFLGHDIKTLEGCTEIRPDTTKTVEGVTVSGLRSTDQGVAFVVEVDGVTIYHAGDLNWWHWEGENPHWLSQVEAAYKTEIDKLSGRQVDVAFVPVDPRLGTATNWAAQYYMSVVDCRTLVPIHLWDDYTVSGKLIVDPASSSFADRVLAVTHRGQCWEL